MHAVGDANDFTGSFSFFNSHGAADLDDNCLENAHADADAHPQWGLADELADADVDHWRRDPDAHRLGDDLVHCRRGRECECDADGVSESVAARHSDGDGLAGRTPARVADGDGLAAVNAAFH